MLLGRSVAVVVPAHNEARWIAGTLRDIPQFVDHIIVVDDGSSDATVAIARGVAIDRPSVDVVRLQRNRGVGAAIVAGYRRGCAAGADVIAVMAGDGQMDPADLAAVVLPVLRGEADYVKGDRVSRRTVGAAMPLARRVGTQVLARLTAVATGLQPLSDSQCGFTAVAARQCDRLELGSIWPRYGYCNDLLGAVARAGLRMAEVPVRPVYRGEASGLRPWHAAGYLFILCRMAWRRARSAAVRVADGSAAGSVETRRPLRSARGARPGPRQPSADLSSLPTTGCRVTAE